MENRYREELEQLCWTESDKQALIRSLHHPEWQNSSSAAAKQKQPRRLLRTGTAFAALACLLVAAVGGVVLREPVLGRYFGNTTAYQKNAVQIGQSITKKGWTVTLTDCLGDRSNLYLGFLITAPEGTQLNNDTISYDFEEAHFEFAEGIGHSGMERWPEDLDPTDNQMFYALSCTCYGGLAEWVDINNKPVRIQLKNFFHYNEWNQAEQHVETETDCAASWDFQITPNFTDNIILEPNVTVKTLDVEATITRMEISPLSVQVSIEGDALKEHHTWTPKNAPDQWYGCIDYQEITAFTKDGQAIPLTKVKPGSGCSGGEKDTDDPGMIRLVRGLEEDGDMIDLSTLASISVCGVNIPLDTADSSVSPTTSASMAP